MDPKVLLVHDGDRIEDWKPLFKAAITGLLNRSNGGTLTI